jgi:hypothetical protein
MEKSPTHIDATLHETPTHFDATLHQTPTQVEDDPAQQKSTPTTVTETQCKS